MEAYWSLGGPLEVNGGLLKVFGSLLQAFEGPLEAFPLLHYRPKNKKQQESVRFGHESAARLIFRLQGSYSMSSNLIVRDMAKKVRKRSPKLQVVVLPTFATFFLKNQIFLQIIKHYRNFQVHCASSFLFFGLWGVLGGDFDTTRRLLTVHHQEYGHKKMEIGPN